MPVTKGIKELLAEANEAVRTVPTAEAIAMLGRDGVTFVDLRDPRELERDGMIPGAFHATRGMLEFWVDPASPYHKPIFAEDRQFVLYCASGWRSALSAKTLVDMGMTNVAHVEGGFTAWKQADGPVGEKPSKGG
ncbi:MAG: rhodanese-like domain-containing protein [Actinomycetota bacterium]